ncbi:MAG: ATP-binding protein, partial [Pseudomonadota bacterium]
HILDRLPSELVVLNNAGQYLYANQSAIQSKLNCGILADHQHSESNDQLNKLGNWAVESKRNDVIEDCLQNKKVVTFEEKINDTNGLDRTILRNLYPLLDQKGEVEFLIGHGVDISARKQSELELQRMAIVAEKTNGIVMVTDPDRKITWVNNSFEQILGYRAEEIIGIDPADFLQGPETSQQTIRDIAESLKASGTFSGEILNYTKGGKQIWLYLNIAAVYDGQGKLLNYIAVENDITVIKLAEQRHQKTMERERELNQFKTQFINLASHQFRTPLATIRSSIDLLDLKLKSIHPDNTFQAFFAKHKAIIDEETTRMTELMENILDIGRIDEGKIELFKKNLPFKKFMDDFVQSNQEPGGEYRKLSYHFGTSDKIISIDEILLRNVLRNIVSNAYKYSQGKPAPELKVNFEKNAYWITVKDYGIGVPDKDQPYLFESFFRASNARIFPGSGLGLMIAKKLIALHGGNIHFSSKVGAGCCVTIHLPA